MDPLGSNDLDPQETREWLDALEGVLEREGPERAHFLIEHLIDRARRVRRLPAVLRQHRVRQHHPGRAAAALPGRLRARAAHPPLRALERDGHGGPREQAHQRRRPHRELRLGRHALRRRLQPLLARLDGGARRRPRLHPGTLRRPASTRAPSCSASSARSSSTNFRQEVDGKGLSSYPHPWLMPDFWQFPTVSMGLGPLMAIYQARFMKYLHDRGIVDTDRAQGVGVHRRRRDGRARVHGRDRHGRPREARQPHLRRELQPAAARRAGARATARSSRSWRARSAAPAGTSSR